MKVEVTHDYKKFRFIRGNRIIVKSKVKKLIDSYNAGLNLFPFCPILINKDFYIIDGQHRLTACKELGTPIHFTTAHWLLKSDWQMAGDAWVKKAGNYIHGIVKEKNSTSALYQIFLDEQNKRAPVSE